MRIYLIIALVIYLIFSFCVSVYNKEVNNEVTSWDEELTCIGLSLIWPVSTIIVLTIWLRKKKG